METNEKTEINILYPEAGSPHLIISVGACRLKVGAGDTDSWVVGTYHDPSGRLPARIISQDNTVRITQSREFMDYLGLIEGVPTINLTLGKSQPYTLTIEGGASDNIFELGGLPLTRLTIKHGAGRNEIDFSTPNPEEMSIIEIGAGAGSITAKNLANTNAAELRIDGGAAAFKCDFGGTLQRDMNARISSGMSSVQVSVPRSTPTKITSEAILGNLDVGDGFMKKEGAFWNEAALQAGAPILTVSASVAMGSLQLRVS